MNEMDLLNKIRLELEKYKCKTMRINVGKVKTIDGKWFNSGAPVGHPDLYGFRSDGRCFYIEVKVHPNKPSSEQLKFIEVAKKYNCLAGVAYSVEDAINIVRGEKMATECEAMKVLGGEMFSDSYPYALPDSELWLDLLSKAYYEDRELFAMLNYLRGVGTMLEKSNNAAVKYLLVPIIDVEKGWTSEEEWNEERRCLNRYGKTLVRLLNTL